MRNRSAVGLATPRLGVAESSKDNRVACLFNLLHSDQSEDLSTIVEVRFGGLMNLY